MKEGEGRGVLAGIGQWAAVRHAGIGLLSAVSRKLNALGLTCGLGWLIASRLLPAKPRADVGF